MHYKWQLKNRDINLLGIFLPQKKTGSQALLAQLPVYCTSYKLLDLSSAYLMWQVRQSALPRLGLIALGKSPDSEAGIPLDTRKNVGLSMLCGS